MERISASIRLGAVVLGSALLGACASSYQQGSTSSPAVTTVNGRVTTSTDTSAYQAQVLQASQNGQTACVKAEVQSGKMVYHSTIAPAGSFQVQPQHGTDAWRCVDYSNGGQHVWALLDTNATGTSDAVVNAEPLGKGLLGIRIHQTEDLSLIHI